MSSSEVLPSVPASPASPLSALGQTDLAAFGGRFANGEAPPKAGKIGRYLAALKRYKWLSLAVVVVGTVGGAVATKFIKPEFEVFATIWIQDAGRGANGGGGAMKRGAIQQGELLDQSAWVELLRSFAISDSVVSEMNLYLEPDQEKDSTVFNGFKLNQGPFRPGHYTLQVEAGKASLVTDAGVEVERVAVGDSLGRTLGFLWRPSARILGTGKRKIEFTVLQPREASVKLRQDLSANLADNSNFLWLSLHGSNPQLLAKTLNSWTRHFTTTAADLKKKNLVEYSQILYRQVATAEAQLHAAEVQLEQFRVGTITKPTESGAAVAAGESSTLDPVFKTYFQQKLDLESVRRARVELEKLLAQTDEGLVGPEALVVVSNMPGAEPLKASLQELYQAQAKLRSMKQFYQSEFKPVKDLEVQIASLEKDQIPQQAGLLLDNLKRKENELQGYVGSATTELQSIPARTIEEMRLRRQVAVSENLYTTLKNSAAEADLAEKGALPDISVLDSAVAPLKPSNNTAPRIIAMAFFGSIGLGIALALLLDQLDRRFQYPDQARVELGLDVIGFVPTIRRRRDGSTDPFEAAQVVEAFRAIRLHLTHSMDSVGRVMLTVTGAGEGDGKSLVASNLAMSFAEAGYRTLLIDGDVRRGALHSTFGVTVMPGLLEFLGGKASMSDIVRPTMYENLSLITSGAKHRRGPELLTSTRLAELLADARGRFDAVIMDSAPLGAGIDAYALGVATGNVLMVLRAGHTDRKLAAAKLELADRLPIRMLGAVLNAVSPEGTYYQYYSYLEGYTGQYEGEAKSLVAAGSSPAPTEEIGSASAAD